MRGKVIAPIPLMIRGVPKEDTTSRARCKLVRCSGREVRVASAQRLEGDHRREGCQRERSEVWKR